MRTTSPTPSFNGRALDALRSLLAQVSAVRLNEIRTRPAAYAPGGTEIIVGIDIYGRSHTLLCAADTASDRVVLRDSLARLRSVADAMSPRATPMIIAPSVSSTVRSLCGEFSIGYLDLDGNARLELGEFFIVRHSVPAVEPRSPRPTPTFSRRAVPSHAVAAV